MKIIGWFDPIFGDLHYTKAHFDRVLARLRESSKKLTPDVEFVKAVMMVFSDAEYFTGKAEPDADELTPEGRQIAILNYIMNPYDQD